jgi:hypothetical protein
MGSSPHDGVTRDSGHAVLDGALRQIRDMLSADDYSLTWSIDERNRLDVRIVAGPDACAECLVPMPVMKAIISDAISSTPYTLHRIERPAP